MKQNIVVNIFTGFDKENLSFDNVAVFSSFKKAVEAIETYCNRENYEFIKRHDEFNTYFWYKTAVGCYYKFELTVRNTNVLF